ncbi:MAG: molybdopterin-synthase adenylyltransferase MoeB [Proteobacteria bacterium]|nr:molybdopterin-synthase adenylyltransferase MoeB [Pseudomonadales bacterium]MBL6804134.1 molybdopterin-synthase adenylyltransferase MoeB [Pseudomonadales bacterium]MDA0804349.1 molybdopterin-synthase adenylyltransferase MoeB [Pseudomonadota bacterium]MDA1244715.1 molybdopterin-synthase adenylyltransferase MoeB [Pseudomonadota bacterium]
MKDDQLLRYSRQIMLPQVDIVGQQAFLDSHVVIVGVGGLGSPAAMYLAAAGVGSLTLVDDDVVELSNLQRQLAHAEADIGKSKAESAAVTLREINSEVKVHVVNRRVGAAELIQLISCASVVLDATDNFDTRFAINRACLSAGIPLVSGAAIRLEGQVAVFDSRVGTSPCYECLYKAGEGGDLTCADNGVLAPVVGIVGSMQALEALKLIGGFGEPLVGRLLLLDASNMQWREMKLPRDPDCAACGTIEESPA